MKKVYFSGAIRGGREYQALYRAAIAALKKRFLVLTEHIGDPALTDAGQAGLTDADIFRQDVAWLTDCDFVVAECSTLSLGVGYELGLADALHKPVYILRKNSAPGRLSAMLAGNPGMTKVYYEDEAALLNWIEMLPE